VYVPTNSSTRTSTPTPGRLGGSPAGSCAGGYLVPQPNHSFPPAVPPEHGAILGLNLAPGATGLPDNSYYYMDVLNGAVNHTNCQAVGAEVSLVQSLPFGDARKGVTADWMTMGAHTVVQVNVYPTGSTPPFTASPTYTAYYGTQYNSSDPTVVNPLYTNVASGVRFADVWNTTGELVIFDTLDWLTRHGSCNYGCDFSGYTLQDLTLSQANGGVFYPYAPGATFRNVTFQAGMQLQGANFHNAIFENVTMDTPSLGGANFSGAQFLGTNTIANADVASASGATSFGSTKAAGVIFDGAHILNNPTAFDGAVFDPDPSKETGDVSFVGAVIGGDISAGGGINFSKAHLRNARFNLAQCNGCVFSQTDLSGADFNQAYLAGARFNGATLTKANRGDALLSTSNGSWTFQLGVSEPPTSISYGPTDFTGADTSTVGSCPDSYVPNGNSNGCAGHTNANPSTAPPVPPACSAAGEDTCALPVTTITGTGAAGSAPGQVASPTGIVVARNGDVYVADTGNHVVRRVSGTSVTTFAGQLGVAGDSGDGGSATAALSAPAGLVGDVYGNLFVADTGNNRIRKIDPARTITTVFGTGTAGYNGSYAQDPITFQWTYPKQATTAQLNHPRGLAVNTGTGLFVADTGNGLVRRLNTSSGATTLLAGKTKESGSGSTVDTSFNGDGLPANQTGFSQPAGVAVTDTGVYSVTDTGHQRVRSVGPSTATGS